MEPSHLPPPDKDSDSYRQLRESLRRKAARDVPVPSPPAPQAEPGTPPSPPPSGEPPAAEPTPPAVPAVEPSPVPRQRRLWIRNRPLRWTISIVLLGITGYCLWYIYLFKLRDETGAIWWPWEKPPPVVRYTTTTTVRTTTTTTVLSEEERARQKEAEETRRLEQERKRAEEEAARAQAEAEKKEREARAALARLEEGELRSVAQLQTNLLAYVQRFQYEAAQQQMARLAEMLQTDKGREKLQLARAGLQPLVEFKRTLIANISAIPYEGRTLVNRQGSPLTGKPSRADENKIYFATPHGEVAYDWVAFAPSQIADLAGYYLGAREQQAPSAAAGKDYFHLTCYCLSQKLTSQAAQYGSEAMQKDPSLAPKVRAMLGNLLR